MHPDGQIVLPGDPLEDREELRFVERPAVDAGADLHAARFELSDRAIHFLERGGHVVHRQRGDEGGEFLRPFRDHLRHAVVGDARKLGRELGSADQLGRGQGEGQHLLHVGKFLIEHGNARLDVPEHAQAGHALDDPLILGMGLEHVEVSRRHDVIEDVDLHEKRLSSIESEF